VTRGERNKNPGNIDRNATKWQGMAPDQSDPRFVVFTDPVWGIRAIAKVLLTYYTRHNLKSVRAIINRWAPPVENDTGAYIKNVASRLGVDPSDDIDLNDPAVMDVLVRAIIQHENGGVIYDDATIASGIERAL
jgi:hypothetical protein